MDGGSTYQSYLMRLWRDNPRAPWQASLQSTATEETFHFADVGQMWTFLQAQRWRGKVIPLSRVKTQPVSRGRARRIESVAKPRSRRGEGRVFSANG